MVFNTTHVANWHAIKARKQEIIAQNNNRENSKRIKYKYQINDKVLVARHDARKLECPFYGPYKVTEVFNNGTVTIKKSRRGGATYERVNIRRIHPYHT